MGRGVARGVGVDVGRGVEVGAGAGLGTNVGRDVGFAIGVAEDTGARLCAGLPLALGLAELLTVGFVPMVAPSLVALDDDRTPGATVPTLACRGPR